MHLDNAWDSVAVYVSIIPLAEGSKDARTSGPVNPNRILIIETSTQDAQPQQLRRTYSVEHLTQRSDPTRVKKDSFFTSSHSFTVSAVPRSPT